LVSLSPVSGDSVASVFVDLGNNLEGPSLERFAEIPDKSASLVASLRLVDAIRALNAGSGLFRSVPSLPASDEHVSWQLDSIKGHSEREAISFSGRIKLGQFGSVLGSKKLYFGAFIR
jgi:hypothetical protein